MLKMFHLSPPYYIYKLLVQIYKNPVYFKNYTTKSVEVLIMY